MQPTGIITTRAPLVAKARNLGLSTVQRIFLLDSQSVHTGLHMARDVKPDYLEVMPGIIPETIRLRVKESPVPIIAGGRDLHQCRRAVAVPDRQGGDAVGPGSNPQRSKRDVLDSHSFLKGETFVRKTYTGELLAEFLGTGMLVLFGDFVVATAILFGAYSGQWQPSILWGLTVMGLVFIFGGVSGAHFNPAVTITVGLFRGFPKAKILPYILAQVLGGAVGAGLLHGLIGPKLAAFEAANNIVRNAASGEATARIFSTYGGAGITPLSAFIIEIILTMGLLLVILAIGDDRQEGAPKNGLGPVVVGATVALLVGIGGPWTMASLNPARDFGPRLWMAIAGWGPTAIPGPNFYMYAPILGPIVGGMLAGVIYEFLVRPYLPAAKPATDKQAA